MTTQSDRHIDKPIYIKACKKMIYIYTYIYTKNIFNRITKVKSSKQSGNLNEHFHTHTYTQD